MRPGPPFVVGYKYLSLAAGAAAGGPLSLLLPGVLVESRPAPVEPPTLVARLAEIPVLRSHRLIYARTLRS